jgi:hypothetical protein
MQSDILHEMAHQALANPNRMKLEALPSLHISTY